MIATTLARLVAVVVLATAATTSAQPLFTAEDYDHSVVFSQDYDLYWTVNHTSQMIHFGLAVKATGWVGLGVSPNGGMAGADMVMAGVRPDGSIYASVRPPSTTPTQHTTHTNPPTHAQHSTTHATQVFFSKGYFFNS